MNKYFYKSVGLYTSEELKDYLELYNEIYDNNCLDIYNSDFQDWLYTQNDFEWENCKNELAKLMENKKYKIEADLGFWYGRRKGTAEAHGFTAVEKCICNDSTFEFELFEERGTLKAKYHHHDGTHNYIIKEITANGLRSPKLWQQLEM